MITIDCERFYAYLDGWLNVLLVTDQDVYITPPNRLDSSGLRFRRDCYSVRDRELYLDLFGCLDAPL